jgi:hypothetical protein
MAFLTQIWIALTDLTLWISVWMGLMDTQIFMWGFNNESTNDRKIISKKVPEGWKEKIVQKGWTEDQDNYIKGHSIQESMDFLKRSKQSVSLRLWRLKKCTK